MNTALLLLVLCAPIESPIITPIEDFNDLRIYHMTTNKGVWFDWKTAEGLADNWEEQKWLREQHKLQKEAISLWEDKFNKLELKLRFSGDKVKLYGDQIEVLEAKNKALEERSRKWYRTGAAIPVGIAIGAGVTAVIVVVVMFLPKTI